MCYLGGENNKMAKWVKGLLYKLDDQSSIACNSYKGGRKRIIPTKMSPDLNKHAMVPLSSTSHIYT